MNVPPFLVACVSAIVVIGCTPHHVRVTVTELGGEPVPGVTVRLEPMYSLRSGWSGKTDPHGRVEMWVDLDAGAMTGVGLVHNGLEYYSHFHRDFKHLATQGIPVGPIGLPGKDLLVRLEELPRR
jgi:hypothetical protein